MIHTTVPLAALLRPSEIRTEAFEWKYRSMLKKASENVQKHRHDILSLILVVNNEDQRNDIFGEFEKYLVRENIHIYEQIYTNWNEKTVVPAFVRRFEGVLDEETKKFLVSAETVQRFAYEHLPDDFDFSLPGSGLWKAVERELNLSLVWYLRWDSGITSADDPWTGLQSPSKFVGLKTGRKTLNLNQRERKDSTRLQGLTLGSIEYMLRWAYQNGVYDKLRRIFKNGPQCERELIFLFGPFDRRKADDGTLPWYLERLRELRNRHAHITAMSPDKFQQLYDIVLGPENDPERSVLGKILQIKKKILEYFRKHTTVYDNELQNR